MCSRSFQLRILFIAFILLSVSACQKLKNPDLKRLYSNSTELTQQPPPVILIHGFAGSRLWDQETKQEIWFENIQKIIFSAYKSLALEFDKESLIPSPNQAIATEVIEEIAGLDYYQNIIKTLTSFGGYQLTQVGESLSGFKRRLYVFKYDWRQDNVVSAKLLSEFIRQIKLDHDDPDLKVDIIAHSMGGLIARYYLRFADQDVLEEKEIKASMSGAKNIRKMILLGTPNSGSVGPVKSMVSGYRIGVRTMPVEIIATMPSVFQMFPEGVSNWLIDLHGKSVGVSVFDLRVWKHFQWSIFHPKVKQRVIDSFENPKNGGEYYKSLVEYFNHQLIRAKGFVTALNIPYPLTTDHEIIVMGGNCNLTPGKIVVEKTKDGTYARLWPGSINQKVEDVDYDQLMLEPGDGRITKSSLLGNQTHKFFSNPYFLCENHARLTSNISFQDNLLHILLSR